MDIEDIKKVGLAYLQVLEAKNKKEEKLDPVDQKALKKDFDDRKDKDIDNDGDVDKSDEYLHKRRKAITKSMKKESVDLDEESRFKMGDIVSDKKGNGEFVVIKVIPHVTKGKPASYRLAKKYGSESPNVWPESRLKLVKSVKESVDLDESQSSLDAHKFKQAAKVKAGIPLRRPGESLAAYITRKAKAQAKMQKEETEEDRIRKHADRINREKSQGLSKTQHKKAMAAADRIHRQRSMAAMKKEEVELDEAKQGPSDETRDTWEKQLSTRKGERDFVNMHKVEKPDFTDGEKVNQKTFADIRKSSPPKKKRWNDQEVGDKKPVPNDGK